MGPVWASRAIVCLGSRADADHVDLGVAREQPREPGRVGLGVLADQHAAGLARGGHASSADEPLDRLEQIVLVELPA